MHVTLHRCVERTRTAHTTMLNKAEEKRKEKNAVSPCQYVHTREKISFQHHVSTKLYERSVSQPTGHRDVCAYACLGRPEYRVVISIGVCHLCYLFSARVLTNLAYHVLCVSSVMRKNKSRTFRDGNLRSHLFLQIELTVYIALCHGGMNKFIFNPAIFDLISCKT